MQRLRVVLLLLVAAPPRSSVGLKLAREPGIGKPSAVPNASTAGRSASELAPSSPAVETPHGDPVSTEEALAARSRLQENLSSIANSSIENCAGDRSTWHGPDLSSPMRVEALRQWLSIPNGDSTLAPSASESSVMLANAVVPKPAFLMMMYTRIVFAKSWEAFFRQGGNRTSTLLLHAKVRTEVPEFFQPYLMQEDVPTARCHDTALMLRMIGLALGDEDVTHIAVVSGDTLPLKPLSFIINDLAQQSRSRFCVDTEWVRAETWLVLERMHASLFVNHLAELRNLIPYSECEDEDLFYWPLAVRQEKLVDQCVMMADWSNTGKYWSKATERCKCPSYLASDKHPGSCGSPSIYTSVSSVGLNELIASPAGYWFARKYLGDGVEGTTLYNGAEKSTLDEEMAKRLIVASGR